MIKINNMACSSRIEYKINTRQQIRISIRLFFIFLFSPNNIASPIIHNNIITDAIQSRATSTARSSFLPNSTHHVIDKEEGFGSDPARNVSGSTKVLFERSYASTAPSSYTEEIANPTTPPDVAEDGAASFENCSLAISDEMTKVKVKDQISSLKLVEFRLKLLNDSTDVFETGFSNIHKANRWSRATPYGHTLLSLAFNYGILSLMTLTVNTNVTNIDIVDRPQGCFAAAGEEKRLVLLREMMMREFDENRDAKNRLLICYEEIVSQKGMMDMNFAKFVNRCCQKDQFDGKERCGPAYQNKWLHILYSFLHLSRIAVLFFGPLLFVGTIIGLSKDEFPYIVKLKEPLPKKISIIRHNSIEPNLSKKTRILDLSGRQRLRNLEKSLANFCPDNPSSIFGQTLNCQIPEYNILVNYKRLLTENSVPVGLWKSLINAVFFCKLRNVNPFIGCCEQDMFKACSCVQKEVKWISLCSKIGIFLLYTVLVPLPYYLRLVILYVFEYEEVISRKNAIRRLNLHESFENSFCHYFLPTHPFFIFIYCIYGTIGFLVLLTERDAEDSIFRRTVIGAFTDLKNLPWTSVIEMAASNFIWPFKRFGLLGVFVCLIYWPIALPLTCLICCVYFLPTVYLTVRMFFYTTDLPPKIKRSYRIKKRLDTSLKMFSMENIYDHFFGSEDKEKMELSKKKKVPTATLR